MRRIGVWGCAITLLLVLVGAFVSFIWLPRAQVGPPRSLFASICSALGVPQSRTTDRTLPSKTRSDIVLTHDLLSESASTDVGHGATLALRCTPCHGPTGISYANSPNLAGQYAIAIYKQLRDYKVGVRTNAVMTPMAESLSDTEMQQLAAYYASLPKPQNSRLTGEPPPIVRWGAPMRNVAPCGSCHGDIDHTMSSPWLKGEPQIYLLEQLRAFAAAERSNDINGQMRAMARGMTAEELQAAAAYYASDALTP